jgi:hypothetical protein
MFPVCLDRAAATVIFVMFSQGRIPDSKEEG